jgi:hypothetical protein
LAYILQKQTNILIAERQMDNSRQTVKRHTHTDKLQMDRNTLRKTKTQRGINSETDRRK